VLPVVGGALLGVGDVLPVGAVPVVDVISVAPGDVTPVGAAVPVEDPVDDVAPEPVGVPAGGVVVVPVLDVPEGVSVPVAEVPLLPEVPLGVLVGELPGVVVVGDSAGTLAAPLGMLRVGEPAGALGADVS
jgi:hypothetical protein